VTRELNDGRKAPRSGQIKSIVVLIHGYGADGADLLGLADPLGPHLPDTLFAAPDAPEPCTGNPFGRQWFPIPWLDGSSDAQAAAGLAAASDDLNAYLDALLEETGVSASNLILLGFSQGTMMALEVAPRRAEAMAGVVAFSGRLLRPEALAMEAKVKPPVLLLHGDRDPVVPFEDMSKAGNTLVAAGFEVYGHVMEGCEHGIAPDGLSTALGFMRDHLK
jgi:phospholipase/carboxylesterase